jgi:hypothetical protein
MATRKIVVALLLALLLAACQQITLPETELPDDGPPIAVTQASAISFIQKTTAAGQSAAESGSSTITLTQEEVTSFLGIGSQLAEQVQGLQNLENIESLEQLEGIEGLEGFEEIQRLSQERENLSELPDLRLPDLSLRLALKEPQVYFRDNGQVIIRGFGEVRGRRQPIRAVMAPRAAEGELVLDFVEGNIGPVEMPASLFTLLGRGVASVILAGQEYAEISEITVGNGTITISGRRNR